MNFIIFLVVCAGITNIVVNSKLFEPIRRFFNSFVQSGVFPIINCSMCFGFWCGLFIYLLMSYFDPKLIVTNKWYIDMVLFGACASISSYILCNIVNDYGIKIFKEKK